MLSLQLLGGLTLADESGPLSGPATQRRRLALLARVAAAPQASVAREKLVTCFWPDEERERARHFLADSVFALRKALGRDVLISGGEDLRLNREVITCDLWIFQEALEKGDPAQAVAAYQGPFLDGFFLADAPEFERWAEEQTIHLARRFADALERAAAEAEEREGAAGALTWWRRLAAQDPYNSRVALRLMRSLAESGERAAALQHARIHAALLREELDLPPDPEVEQYASALLTGPPVVVRSPPSPTPLEREAAPEPTLPSTSIDVPDATGAPPAAVAAPAGPRPDSEGRLAPPRPAFRHRRRVILLIPILLIGLLSTLTTWRNDPVAARSAESSDSSPTPIRTIAILPFAYQGPADDAFLSDGIVTLLASSLHGASNLRALDPYVVLGQVSARTGQPGGTPLSPEDAGAFAARFGADLILLGTIAGSGDGFRLTASLYRQGNPPEVIRTTAVEGADPAQLVDRLARDLLVGELREPADRLTLVAATTTSSVPALKAYLEGERAFRAALYPEAVEALQRAVREDPDFALAHYRLSTSAEWSFRFTEARRSAREAQELAAELSERDRRLVAAWHAFVNGQAERAQRLYNAVLTDDPDDVEARAGLGEVLLHFNAVRGAQPSEARTAFERVLRLAPDFGEARLHLMEMAAERRDLVAFDSLLLRIDPGSTQGRAWGLARAVVGREEADVARAVYSLHDVEDLVVGVAAVRAAANFRDLEAGRALAMQLTLPERPTSWRAAGLIMAAQGSLALGDFAEADRTLREARELEPGWALEIGALGLLLPLSSPSQAALRRTHDELEAWNPRAADPETSFFFGVHAEAHAELRLYLLTLLDLRLGDEAHADGHLTELRARGDGLSGIGTSLASSAAAHRAWYRRDAAETLQILEADQPRIPLERIALSPFFARALDRYLRAEALAALGRKDEALRWHASLTVGPDLLFWAASHKRQAELLTDLGRTADAQAHEQRFLALAPPSTLLTNANQAPASDPPFPRVDAVSR